MNKVRTSFVQLVAAAMAPQRILQFLSVLVSGLMTSLFLASLGVGWVQQWLLGAFGVVLELTKVWAWDRAAQRRRPALIVLAAAISLMSLLGSLAFSSFSFGSSTERETQRTAANRNIGSVIESLRSQRTELERNLKALDPTWVSLRLRLQDKLEALTTKELTLIDKMADPQVPSSGLDIHTGSTVLGVPTPILMNLGFLLFGIIVEISIGVLTFERRRDRLATIGSVELIEGFCLLAPWIDGTGRIPARSEIPRNELSERDWRRAVATLGTNGLLKRRDSDRSYEIDLSLLGLLKVFGRQI